MSKINAWIKKQWYGVQEAANCEICGGYSQDAQLVGRNGEIKIHWCQPCYDKYKNALV